MNQTSWIQPKSGLFFCLWNRPPPRSTRTDALMPYTALSPTALAVGRSDDDRRLRAFGPRDAATDRAAAADARGRAERPPGSQHPAFRLARSEEHTSELQSLMRISYAVFCLKKKNKGTDTVKHHNNQYNKQRPQNKTTKR